MKGKVLPKIIENFILLFCMNLANESHFSMLIFNQNNYNGNSLNWLISVGGVTTTGDPCKKNPIILLHLNHILRFLIYF